MAGILNALVLLNQMSVGSVKTFYSDLYNPRRKLFIRKVAPALFLAVAAQSTDPYYNRVASNITRMDWIMLAQIPGHFRTSLALAQIISGGRFTISPNTPGRVNRGARISNSNSNSN
jgi:hypothetical protein